MLQWGRAVEGAETYHCALRWVAEELLQWGRAVEGAETSDANPYAYPDSWLQWGRAVEGAETGSLGACLALLHGASMGPRR